MSNQTWRCQKELRDFTLSLSFVSLIALTLIPPVSDASSNAEVVLNLISKFGIGIGYMVFGMRFHA